MDNIPEITPHKKRKKFTLTFALSFKVIIQVWKSQQVFQKYLQLLSLIDVRNADKESKLTEFTDRIENISVVDIIKQNGSYHRECCKTF